VTWAFTPAGTIQQTGPASGYQVFDATNATLVATGVTATAAGTTTSVTLDNALTGGTNYTLRVAPGTVQNPTGNIPNQAQTKAFAEATTSAANSTVTSSPGTVPADGATTSTITVTLKNGTGTPVAGHTVALSQNGSAVISAPSGTSTAGGVVTFTVSDTTAETVTFTATDTTDGVVIAQTAQVIFTDVPTITITGGPADNALVNNTQPAYSGTADSTPPATVSVQRQICGPAPTGCGAFNATDVNLSAPGTSSTGWTWQNAAPLPQGAYTFNFRAVDSNGAISALATRNLTIDTTNPVVVINSPTTATPATTWNEGGEAHSVNVSVTEANCWTPQMFYKKNSDAAFTLLATYATQCGNLTANFGVFTPTIPDNTDQNVDLKFVATDAAGNVGSNTQSNALFPLRDTTAPTVTSSSGTGVLLNLNMSESSHINTVTNIQVRSADGTTVLATGAASNNDTTALLVVLNAALTPGGQYSVWVVNSTSTITDNDLNHNPITTSVPAQISTFTAT